MKLYIGTDLGTSGLKMTLIDEKANILEEVVKSYPLYIQGVNSEQNPLDWWNAFEEAIEEILVGRDKMDVHAISFSGQMHGLVALDEDDQVIRNCILWNDSRSKEETDYLNDVIGKDVLDKETENIAYCGFTAPKLLWMERHEKENFSRIRKIMLPKDYLVYRLTGRFVSDYSDMSGSLLLDCSRKEYSKKMIEICHLREDVLPKLMESSGFVSYPSQDFLSRHGLSNMKVIMGGADNALAAIGMGSLKEGEANISLGTSGTILLPLDHPIHTQHNELHMFASATGRWYLMGCILSAASCRKWWLEKVLSTNDYAKDEEDMKDAPTDGLFFLPYLSGERSPINDPQARGCFLGLSHETDKGSMSKAVLEGVSFALRDCLEIAKKQGLSFQKATLCGGGRKSEIWCQMLSDIFNLDIHVSGGSPSFGAALLALSSDQGKDLEALTMKAISYDRVYRPNQEKVRLYEEKYQKFHAIYPLLKDWFDRS